MKNVVLPDLSHDLKLRLPPGLSADASALAEAVAPRSVQPVPRIVTPGMTRRGFVRTALAASALAAGISRTARAGQLPPTQSDMEGPYYRANAPFRQVLFDDEYFVKPFFLWGYIMNTDADPLPGALLDFWQADDGGNYDNSSPGYQGRGRQFADDYGIWWIYTTWPGYYPGRPWHIHLRTSQKGYRTLTTQLYFRDDPRQHPPALEMDWYEFKEWPGLYGAYFNIVMQSA